MSVFAEILLRDHHAWCGDCELSVFPRGTLAPNAGPRRIEKVCPERADGRHRWLEERPASYRNVMPISEEDIEDFYGIRWAGE